MYNNFFKTRSRKTIWGLFLSLWARQLRDSKFAYLWISIGILVFTLFSWASLTWEPRYFFSFTKETIKQSDALFNLFPPFLLTIVAIFPAFSEKTKMKLREPNKGGEPRVAAFLDQFVFLVLLSLLLLFSSKLYNSMDIYEIKESVTFDCAFWLVAFADIYLFLVLSLTWEILDSIKSLYILILREYYNEGPHPGS